MEREHIKLVRMKMDLRSMREIGFSMNGMVRVYRPGKMAISIPVNGRRVRDRV